MGMRLSDKSAIKLATAPVWQQQKQHVVAGGGDALATLQPGDVFSTFSKLLPLKCYSGGLGQVSKCV